MTPNWALWYHIEYTLNSYWIYILSATDCRDTLYSAGKFGPAGSCIWIRVLQICIFQHLSKPKILYISLLVVLFRLHFLIIVIFHQATDDTSWILPSLLCIHMLCLRPLILVVPLHWIHYSRCIVTIAKYRIISFVN